MGSRLLAVTLAALVSLGGLPAVAAEGSKQPNGARISGTVRDAADKPVPGARVVLSPLQAHGSQVSIVTKSDGSYEVEHVGHGLYEFGIEKDGKSYAGNRVLLVSPGKKMQANFHLGAFEPNDRSAGLEVGQGVPGLQAPATGVARLDERVGPSGLAWLRTGKGVAVLIGGSALLVGALIALGGRGANRTASPSSPTGGK